MTQAILPARANSCLSIEPGKQDCLPRVGRVHLIVWRRRSSCSASISFCPRTLACSSGIKSTARLAADDIYSVKNDQGSPRIKHVSWGRLDVEGKAEPYKDAKLFPGGSTEWNWRETGTNHLPGIQPADIQELLDHGSRVVVLSRGMKECLQVPPETLDFLKERQIAAHVLPTPDAVKLYNQLAEKEAVGGLFHTTC